MAAVARRYINMWTFLSLHPANIELLQRLKSADDRQFGTHMDICGEVSEQDPRTLTWADTHVVGMRTDIWNPDRANSSRHSTRCIDTAEISTDATSGRQAA